MRILIISTQYPYPKDNGKKIILASFLEYFLDQYGEENVEYALVGEKLRDNVPYLKKQINKPGILTQMKNVITYSLILKSKSIQESVLYSSKISKDFVQYIDRNNFDIVIYDTVRISQLFEGHNFSKSKEFVYLDDLFSIRYEKMLQSMKNYPDVDFNVIGNFAKFIPKFAKNIVSLKFLSKFLLNAEKKLINKREIITANRFQNTLLISQKEVNILNDVSGGDNVKSIRPIVNRVNKNYNRLLGKKKTFVFLGALNIPHNDVSICNFIRLNMDNIIREIPDIKILIIGKNPSKQLLKLVENYPEKVELLGFVENLDDIFSKAYGMIIPLLFGSGVKLKTLEAFSRGLPVIATDYGFEGIDLPYIGECIVENDIKSYVQHMKSLTNHSINQRMSKLAYDFFYSNYSKEAVYMQYDNIFK